MSELGKNARDALQAYRDDVQVPAGRADANWAELESRLQQGGSSADTSSAEAASGSSKGVLAVAAAVAGVVIVALVLGGGDDDAPLEVEPAVQVAQEVPSEARESVPKVTPGPSVEPSVEEAAAVEPEPEPSVEPEPEPEAAKAVVTDEDAKLAKKKPVAKPKQAPEPQLDADLLAAEAALIAQIKDAMVAAEHQRALELIKRHRKEFKRGVMSEDRRAFEAMTLCALGKDERGKSAADAFLSSFPRSTHAPRVRAECGLN